MLHERPNESFHWKNKLDELDHLPGEQVTDRTASWQKLHGRLRENRKHPGPIWYWLAAACVLMAVILPWTLSNRNNYKVISDNNQQVPKQSADERKIVKEGFPIIKQPNIGVGKEKKQVIPAADKLKTRHVSKHPLLVERPVAIDTAKTKEPAPDITFSNHSSSDTANIKVITTAPVKKKLRVLHINELVKPADEQVQYAKATLQPASQGGLFRQNYLPALPVGKNTSDNFIKIKLSPSN